MWKTIYFKKGFTKGNTYFILPWCYTILCFVYILNSKVLYHILVYISLMLIINLVHCVCVVFFCFISFVKILCLLLTIMSLCLPYKISYTCIVGDNNNNNNKNKKISRLNKLIKHLLLYVILVCVFDLQWVSSHTYIVYSAQTKMLRITIHHSTLLHMSNKEVEIEA